MRNLKYSVIERFLELLSWNLKVTFGYLLLGGCLWRNNFEATLYGYHFEYFLLHGSTEVI